MKTLSGQHKYEEAAVLRNRLRDLKQLGQQIIFSDREFMDLSKDQGLVGLQRLLGLTDIPKRIEGYDISHMSGTNNVASMVVATNGLADKSQYRKFKMQLPGNNDFAHMNETIRRRFGGRHDEWPTPDLLLIDGGKGQLGAALEALDDADITMPVIGLAKRDEQIVIRRREEESGKREEVATLNSEVARQLGAYVEESDGFYMVTLPKSSHIIKLLQRIRNESHRFAVSYHSTLKRKGATKSLLDDIPGVGAATRKKLITSFGSGQGVKSATQSDLAAVIGEKLAQTIYAWFRNG